MPNKPRHANPAVSHALGLALFVSSVATAQPKPLPSETTLQSIKNVDAFQTTEGNSFKLISQEKGCRIEAMFYGETGKVRANYLFTMRRLKPQLNHAARYEYDYSDGGLTNLSDNKGQFHVQNPQRQELNTQSATILSDFHQMVALFPKTSLQSCE